MAEVLHFLAKEEALLHLELDASVFEQRQHRIEMVEVFLVVAREEDDIVEVHESDVPSRAGYDHVEGALEGRRCIAETEKHSIVPMRPNVARERRLVSFFLCNGNLPVTSEGVQHREDLGVSQAIDTVFHARGRVRVRNRGGIEAAKVDAETHSAVLFRSQEYRACPLRVRGFYDAYLDLISDLLTDVLMLLGTGAIRLLSNGSSARLQLNVVLCRVDRAKLAGTHRLVLFEKAHDLYAKRRMSEVREVDVFLPGIRILSTRRIIHLPLSDEGVFPDAAGIGKSETGWSSTC